MTMVSMMAAAGMAAACLGIAPAAIAQNQQARADDPVVRQSLDSRQYRGEPKANSKQRGERCRIVTQRGQDKRVCGKPVRSSVPK